MAANFAAPVSRWWELLPDKLTSYRICQHVINMLKKQDPDRATTRSISGIFNPATREYDKVEEDASQTAPVTRKQLADKGLCANTGCAHGKGGGRKKKPKGKVDRKKQFISNLCPACYEDNRSTTVQQVLQPQQQQHQRIMFANLEAPPWTFKSLGGCVVPANTTNCCY